MGHRGLFGLVLALALLAGCASPGAGALDGLVGSARSASDHRKIADLYRREAAKAREEGLGHRRLATAYAGRHSWGAAFAERAGRHCNDLADAEEERAVRFELLAVEHDRLAHE